MIFDYIYDLPNSTIGLDSIIIETATEFNSLIPLTLIFIWFFVLLGGSARQSLRSGSADYALWSVVASLSTFLVTLLMSVIPGLINVSWLAITIIITIFSVTYLWLDRRSGEV